MLKTNYKIIAWISVAALIGTVSMYVFEITHLSNTLDASNMIWKAVLIALLIGLVVGKRIEHRGVELVDSLRIWAASLLIPIFFSPLIASLTNRVLSFHEPAFQVFEFIEEVPFASSAYGFLKDEKVEPTGCYLFVFHSGKIKRLKQKKCKFFGKERGEDVQLKLKKGLWGYSVVLLD